MFVLRCGAHHVRLALTIRKLFTHRRLYVFVFWNNMYTHRYMCDVRRKHISKWICIFSVNIVSRERECTHTLYDFRFLTLRAIKFCICTAARFLLWWWWAQPAYMAVACGVASFLRGVRHLESLWFVAFESRIHTLTMSKKKACVARARDHALLRLATAETQITFARRRMAKECIFRILYFICVCHPPRTINNKTKHISYNSAIYALARIFRLPLFICVFFFYYPLAMGRRNSSFFVYV